MAVLDHHGVEHLISKIANKFANAGSAYPLVYHDTNETSCMIKSNVLNVWDVMQELTIYLSSMNSSNVANEYIFQFASGEVPTVLTIARNIKWNSSEPPVIEANKIYQISILNDLATLMSWDL